MMEIIERFRTKYHERRKDRIQYVVVHYTGTAAGAAANARALEKELKSPRSTHYFVEGDKVLATVPEERTAWHVGCPAEQRKIPCTNANAIGVDLCEDKLVYDKEHRSVEDRDWYFTDETEATGAELIADICRRHKIPLDHVVRHFDVTGKWCPRPFVGDDVNTAYKESGNERWRGFVALIREYLEGVDR